MSYLEERELIVLANRECDKLQAELQSLKEENTDLQEGADALRELNKFMRRNYDKKIEKLRSLLIECKFLLCEYNYTFEMQDLEKSKDVLSRINAAIGESEEK